jgi:hypothetical protein
MRCLEIAEVMYLLGDLSHLSLQLQCGPLGIQLF